MTIKPTEPIKSLVPTNWVAIAGAHADRHKGTMALKYLDKEKLWRITVEAGKMHSGIAKAPGIQEAAEKLCRTLKLQAKP